MSWRQKNGGRGGWGWGGGGGSEHFFQCRSLAVTCASGSNRAWECMAASEPRYIHNLPQGISSVSFKLAVGHFQLWKLKMLSLFEPYELPRVCLVPSFSFLFISLYFLLFRSTTFFSELIQLIVSLHRHLLLEIAETMHKGVKTPHVSQFLSESSSIRNTGKAT